MKSEVTPDVGVQETASVQDGTTVGIEKEQIQVNADGTVVDHGLHRSLKQRHLQMIALGGVVGASIWYGTGLAIVSSGPIGALISFIVIGIDVFFIMQSLGELSTMYPSTGAFTELAGRFIDPAVAVALGWNYWYLWASNIASEYNLVSIVLSYWSDAVPSYGWVLIAWAFYQCIAMFGVMVYGETEFWLAIWKILCILVTYLLAILCNTGAIGNDYIGFRYWKNPGPIVNGINGFGQSFVLAAVYHGGTEMVAITAGESRNPSRDIPKAIRQTVFRIVIIYWGLVFFAGISVASNDPSIFAATSRAGMSPFSIALQNAGWSHGPDLINAFIFTASFSAINSSIYIASRTLYSLADQGRAPRFLLKTYRGVPVYCTLVSNLVGLLALINSASGAGKVFTYLIDLAGAAIFIAWLCIGVTHLRFRKAWRLQGYTAKDLPFRALWYPWGTYFITALNLFLLLIQGYESLIHPWHPVDFVFSYIVIVLFLILLVGWKVLKKTKLVNLAEVDLQYGRRTYLSSAEDVEAPSFVTRAFRSVKNRLSS
ncbi:hypothetical protein A1O3_07755 [Capronia epimyces CBS 606.96]|uniref:Amino acid permease/ SLC12A domain-containing protein n=1 Tax=Capronia epimyces CBS 606.96 TaxID=1182542 RepID=W9XMN9_9EURO|nr:uncharacterized protein A1O3_07755 [Capronia epimyces CBS 606.96]EXJ81463.1 hypothetical protein A1O3_07755 [Capronia epimyces CBS 606.96]